MTEDTMVEDAELGVPNGVLALARSLLAGEAAKCSSSENRILGTVMDGAAAGGPAATRAIELLTAPRRLEPNWPEPADAIAVGRGWVHAEIIDDDQPLFDALVSDSRHGRAGEPTPEGLCAAAQELRLPVSPYRALPAIEHIVPSSSDAPADVRPVVVRSPGHSRPSHSAAERAVIVDLSTHWAGPLATKLLAEAGATVIKIDPDCRPDGFRSRPSFYHHLNSQKQVVDLDLRSPEGRSRFERLVSEADLVVESFSARVMPNLGYGPDAIATLNPNCSTVSIRAFPSGGPESDWVGYGPGVHAASGLGLVGVDDGLAGVPGLAPRPAALAYPDFLGGLTAYRRALTLLSVPQRQPQREVSLLGSIAPLVAVAVSATTASARTTNVGHDV